MILQIGGTDLADISTKSKPSCSAFFKPSIFEQTTFSTLSPTNLIVSALIKLLIRCGFSFLILQGFLPLCRLFIAIT